MQPPGPYSFIVSASGMNTAVYGLYWLAVNYFVLRSWLVTICDIWPVVGVINMMNATCGTGLYLPSWTFLSNSSFNGVPVAQTLVFLWGPLFAFCSFSFWPLSFGMLVLITQMLSSDFPFAYWVSHYHCT